MGELFRAYYKSLEQRKSLMRELERDSDKDGDAVREKDGMVLRQKEVVREGKKVKAGDSE